MNPIRAALVSSDTSLQSGAAHCLLRLAIGLRDLGHEPVLLLSDLTGIAVGAKQAGIEVYRMRARRPALRRGWRGVAEWVINFPGSTVALARQLHHLRVSVVHANEFIELQAGVAARLMRLPCVYHVRWLLGTSLAERCVARLVTMLSGGLIFVSEGSRGAFDRAAGVTRGGKPAWVIDDPGPGHVETDPRARDEVRMEFGLPAESLLVLQVCKLTPDKGQDTFLEAAARVVSRMPEAAFVIAGGETPGHEQYASHLAALASQEPLRGKVVLAGFRGDIPRLMGAADLVVHCPSRTEAFAGAVVEAMATGRAVVGVDMGGIADRVENEVTGILVRPGDVEELAQAILRVLGDADLRMRLGAAARRKYESRYSAAEHAAAVSGVYAHLIKTARGA